MIASFNPSIINCIERAANIIPIILDKTCKSFFDINFSDLIIIKKNKQVINNTTNKTINYLDSNYGDMIAMSKFLYNLEHHEQLTHHERELLLMAYKENGIDMFARSFSHVMKENCRRQLLKEGLPDWKLLPLFCSDGNLRSHKEKGDQGWTTHYDNQSIVFFCNLRKI